MGFKFLKQFPQLKFLKNYPNVKSCKFIYSPNTIFLEKSSEYLTPTTPADYQKMTAPALTLKIANNSQR